MHYWSGNGTSLLLCMESYKKIYQQAWFASNIEVASNRLYASILATKIEHQLSKWTRLEYSSSCYDVTYLYDSPWNCMQSTVWFSHLLHWTDHASTSKMFWPAHMNTVLPHTNSHIATRHSYASPTRYEQLTSNMKRDISLIYFLLPPHFVKHPGSLLRCLLP